MSKSDVGETDSQCNEPSGMGHELPIGPDQLSDAKLSDGITIDSGHRRNIVISNQAGTEPVAALSALMDTDENETSGASDAEVKGDLEKATTTTSDIPYSSYTTWQKRFIILAASMGGFLSPLTSNIYYPALNTISYDLHVSLTLVNLSITTYMVFQGISPTFVGGFSDGAGRRPAYMIGFAIYLAANVGLALQDNYVALMVLRCVQSAGSSGMVALATGVVADCITSSERGSYIGFTSVSTVLGPSLSPILGGVISQYLGWHAIFWFLAIFGGILCLLFLFFFPETCRNVVGDGSVPPPTWNQSVIGYMNQRKLSKVGISPDYATRDALAQSRHVRFPNPLGTLRIIADKEVALIMSYSSVVYAGYYALTTTVTTQFKLIYGYDNTVLGLMFLPICAGGILATITNGKWDPVDGNFRRHAQRLGMSLKKNRHQDLSNFPIERARLEIVMPLLYASCVILLIYGWVLHAEVSVAGPLVLLFFLGFCLTCMFKVMTILIIDIAPGKPATAAAAFNLTRCLLGAAMTAIVNPIINALGTGWTFTLISLVWVILSPMLLAVVKWGPAWRRERQAKDVRREEQRQEKRQDKIAARLEREFKKGGP